MKKHPVALFALAITALPILGQEQNTSFSYTNFSDVSDLTFVRSASTRGNRLDLNGTIGNTTGAVWTKEKYRVSDGFRVTYTFQIGALTGSGSDGIWFYVQNRAADAAWTPGYGNSPPGGTPLNDDYFVVAIDTFQNGWDPNNWHMEWGYAGFGRNEQILQTPLPDTKNSNVHTITIDYNATAKRVSAFYDGTLVFESDLDLENTISLDNGTAYIGCVGVSGGPAESHEILSWEFDQRDEQPDLNEGLVAYYPFNGNANDASGNGNHLTAQGSPEYIEGVRGNAIRFDGIDDAVLTERLISGNGFTWTGWFKVLSESAGLMAQANPTVRISPNVYYNPDGRIVFYTYTFTGHEVSYDEPRLRQEWTSVSVVVNDNGSKRIYVNGELKAENSSPAGFGEQNASFVMGRGWTAAGNHNHFQADEVRIYDRALSGREVGTLYDLEKPEPTLTDGLVAYYPFNGNANDESGNGINGTVNGPILTTDRNGNPDSAYRFDRNQAQHIILPDAESIRQLGNNYSFSFWVSTEDPTQDAYIISKDGWAVGSAQWFILLGYDDERITFGHAGGPGHVSSPFPASAWQHFTITHQGSSLKIFRNGSLDIEREGNMPLAVAAGRGVRFGGPRGTTASHFTGELDDVRIYNRALSEQEVSALYELENTPSTYTLEIAATNNGSVDGAGTYPAGTEATMTASPDLGYLFRAWTGNASGTDNPRSLVMDRDRTVGAVFTEDQRDPDADGLSNYEELVLHGTDPDFADTDRDGLRDGWEVRYLGTDPLLTDTDGDGFDDYYELRNRFDPTTAESTPEAVATVFPIGDFQGIEFGFNTAKGVHYRVESSTDLTNWTTEETGILGRGGLVYRFFSTESRPKAFFRARRE